MTARSRIVRSARPRPRRRWTVAALVLLTAVSPIACTHHQGSLQGFCRAVRDAPDLATSLTGFTDADPVELRSRLDTTRQAYARIAEEAPGEIRSDARRMVDLVDAVVDAAARQPDDPTDAVAQTRKAVADHPGAARSATSVSRYASRNCDVTLNPEAATTTTK